MHMMFKVTVSGIPEKLIGGSSDKILAELARLIQKRISLTMTNEVNSEDVFVQFPKDLCERGLGEEITVEIQRVHQSSLSPVGESLIVNSVSNVVCSWVYKHIPNCKDVVCGFVSPMNRAVSKVPFSAKEV